MFSTHILMTKENHTDNRIDILYNKLRVYSNIALSLNLKFNTANLTENGTFWYNWTAIDYCTIKVI